MLEVIQSLQSVTSFFAYFFVALALVASFKVIYVMLTPHNEFDLIKHGNVAAAVQFAGAIIGFCIPLFSAISHSVSMLDFVSWGVVALVVQVSVFFIASKFVMDFSTHIKESNVAAGVLSAALSLSAGLINAACMTY